MIAGNYDYHIVLNMKKYIRIVIIFAFELVFALLMGIKYYNPVRMQLQKTETRGFILFLFC